MPVVTKVSQTIQEEIERYLEKKEGLDSIVNLSQGGEKTEKLSVKKVENKDGYLTLLSEGAVLFGDDTIRLYIAKGTLSKWYESLEDDYEGYVTVGHVPLDAFPVRQGTFKKEDLKIVTDSKGRSDLLVKPRVNMELSFFKDLLLQNEPFAISSEFRYTDMEEPDIEEYTKLVVYNLEKGGDIFVPITDNVEITGFSFVANPGNAKSGGYEPTILVKNEEERLKKTELLNKILEQLSKEEEAVEEVKAETLEEVAVEEPKAEEAEEVVEELTNKEILEKIEALTAQVTELNASNEELLKENEALKAENAKFKAEENEVTEQLTKLEALLSKSNASVEKVELKKEEEAPKSIFGRTRFGGLN